MFLLIVVIYLAIGVSVEYIEELIISAQAKEIFRDRVEVLSFDSNGIFDPIFERINDYNITWLLTDINDIILWPFGIIWWLRGVYKMRNMSDSELDEVVEQMKNR